MHKGILIDHDIFDYHIELSFQWNIEQLEDDLFEMQDEEESIDFEILLQY